MDSANVLRTCSVDNEISRLGEMGRKVPRLHTVGRKLLRHHAVNHGESWPVVIGRKVPHSDVDGAKTPQPVSHTQMAASYRDLVRAALRYRDLVQLVPRYPGHTQLPARYINK